MKIIINLGREILLLGSVRESIMKPSETSSGKNKFFVLSFNVRRFRRKFSIRTNQKNTYSII
jgi:hypothetical protein